MTIIPYEKYIFFNYTLNSKLAIGPLLFFRKQLFHYLLFKANWLKSFKQWLDWPSSFFFTKTSPIVWKEKNYLFIYFWLKIIIYLFIYSQNEAAVSGIWVSLFFCHQKWFLSFFFGVKDSKELKVFINARVFCQLILLSWMENWFTVWLFVNGIGMTWIQV